MIELKEAIYWKLVNNKDLVVNTARIAGDKLSNYIGTGTTNRILYSYPDINKNDPKYPCMVISVQDDIDEIRTETARAMVQIYLYTNSEAAMGKHHSQLEAFFKLVKYFLAEQWDEYNDLEEVEDGDSNLVIGDKFFVESFTLNWKGEAILLPSTNEYQLPSRWISYLTETQEA